MSAAAKTGCTVPYLIDMMPTAEPSDGIIGSTWYWSSNGKDPSESDAVPVMGIGSGLVDVATARRLVSRPLCQVLTGSVSELTLAAIISSRRISSRREQGTFVTSQPALITSLLRDRMYRYQGGT